MKRATIFTLLLIASLSFGFAGDLTILVNGSFDDSPAWEDPSSTEYAAIAATFGGTPVAYHWDGINVFFPAYSSIYAGGFGLADFINSHQLNPGDKLNVIAHSHGGNVVKIASYFVTHPINNLINLGTPQNYDLPAIVWNVISNYCQVSSFTDYVQFAGASPYQIYAFGYDQYAAGVWLAQEFTDLFNGDYWAAADDAAEVAFYEADAAYWWFSTKIAVDSPFAINPLFGTESHSDLHEVPVWNAIKQPCGLP